METVLLQYSFLNRNVPHVNQMAGPRYSGFGNTHGAAGIPSVRARGKVILIKHKLLSPAVFTMCPNEMHISYHTRRMSNH